MPQRPVMGMIKGIIEECRFRDGVSCSGKPWRKYEIKIEGECVTTFSKTRYEACLFLKEHDKEVVIEYVVGKYGKEFDGICESSEYAKKLSG